MILKRKADNNPIIFGLILFACSIVARLMVIWHFVYTESSNAFEAVKSNPLKFGGIILAIGFWFFNFRGLLVRLKYIVTTQTISNKSGINYNMLFFVRTTDYISILGYEFLGIIINVIGSQRKTAKVFSN